MTVWLRGLPKLAWLALGLLLMLAGTALRGGTAAATVALILSGSVICVSTLRVRAAVRHDSIRIVNHVRSWTIELSTVVGCSSELTAVPLTGVTSWARVVLLVESGERRPIAATTGMSPESARRFVAGLLERNPSLHDGVVWADFPRPGATKA